MLAVYVMLLISATTLEMAYNVCLWTEATSTDRHPMYPRELLHVSCTPQAVCHCLRARHHGRLQPLRQAYGETLSRKRSLNSTSHLFILSLLIWIHKVIIIILIVVTPARLSVILQLLFYFAVIGGFACLTARALVEDVAEVEFFIFEVFIVAFLFRCALEVGVSGVAVRWGVGVCCLGWRWRCN